MKNLIIIATLLLCSTICNAQEETTLQVFKTTDSTWLNEIIKFPLGFAKEINYEGYEDLKFAKNWRKQDSPDFWSYTFAWHVKGIHNPNTTTLEQQLKRYYDGLMTAVNKKKDFKIPETTVLFIKNESNTLDTNYIGKIKTYDSFNTKAMITLNVRAKMHYCDLKKETIMVFNLSPQTFDGGIWERFKALEIRKNICD